MSIREAALVLSDGSVFEGELFGATTDGPVAGCGEVVFNTVLSGYQEVITDPSYAGQIITFTYPHIGNYGTNAVDFESRRPFCRGIVIRDMARRASNYRATASLDATLARYGLCAIGGIDTRRLTRLLRDGGSVIGAFGTGTVDQLNAAIAVEPGTAGIDLVSQVTTPSSYHIASAVPRRIVAIDFGLKQSILRDLAGIGSVQVLPASATAADILAAQPDGVFLSNGPGDPEVVDYAVDAIRQLLGQVPVFGICLGHQLLALALDGSTFKLPFGHHGGNHPVRHEASGKVEITSQNHNFCVDPDSIRHAANVTHINLNDQTLEGMMVRDTPAFSVQYHPEAGPGPHDSKYLFGLFASMIDDPTSFIAGSPRSFAVGTLSAGYESEQLIQPERGVA